MDELKIALTQISFLKLHEKIILRKKLDSLDKLALMSINDISLSVGRNVSAQEWNGKLLVEQTKKAVCIMKKLNIKAVSIDDEEYPALLKEIFNPPYVIFYRGNIECLSKKCVSVVGTRKISRNGQNAAFSFAKDAALDGCTVISGLAYGTDTFAHKGAVFAANENSISGTTAAILPCGIDTVIPSANKRLVEQILRTKGCVLSEYIPGCPAEPWRFVQRNRIIAALSWATLIIEAPPGSGALITAAFAIDYNRDLLFHSSCFTKDALEISKIKKNLLEHSGNKNDEAKLMRTPEFYIEDGASVINSYEEFICAVNAEPGFHNLKNDKQLSLF